MGALFGEAVVFPKADLIPHFFTQIKQNGALLAKGRLLGLQFDALFTDGLYLDLSRHAIAMAEQLKDILRRKGYRFYLETPTNQQFVVVENGQMEELAKRVSFGFWEELDEAHTVIASPPAGPLDRRAWWNWRRCCNVFRRNTNPPSDCKSGG